MSRLIFFFRCNTSLKTFQNWAPHIYLDQEQILQNGAQLLKGCLSWKVRHRTPGWSGSEMTWVDLSFGWIDLKTRYRRNQKKETSFGEDLRIIYDWEDFNLICKYSKNRKFWKCHILR